MSPSPQPTSTPAVPPPTPTPAGEIISVRVSHYWPPLGGTSCAVYIGTPPSGECISKVWGGTQSWESWVGRSGIACPPEWEFGTRLTINGRTWTCMDRGGAIQFVNGIPWVDMLIPEPIYIHGTVVEAYLQEQHP